MSGSEELRAKWRERDARYAHNSQRLTENMAASVRASREMEVKDLPPDDRAKAWVVLAAWAPPSVLR